MSLAPSRAGRGASLGGPERALTRPTDHRPDLGLAIGAARSEEEEVAAALRADGLTPAIEEEFARQGARPPGPHEVAAVARVVAGYLRTAAALPALDGAGVRAQAVEAFVAAYLRLPRVGAAEVRIPQHIDGGFAQRGRALPPPSTLVALVALARGALRSGAMPRSPAGQAALSDWVVSLYVAGDET